MVRGEITIGIPVEKGEGHPAVGGDLVFGSDIREELERGRLRLCSSHAEVQGAAYRKGQLFIIKAFANGEVEVRPVQVEFTLVDIVDQVVAIIKGGIEIDP